MGYEPLDPLSPNKQTKHVYIKSNTNSRISDIFHVGRRTYLFACWVPYKTAFSALFLSAFIDKHANAPLNHMKLVKFFPMSARRPTEILFSATFKKSLKFHCQHFSKDTSRIEIGPVSLTFIQN